MGWLEEQLAQASPNLLRSMAQTFAEALMGAEAGAVCGERSDERTNRGNGYLSRPYFSRARLPTVPSWTPLRLRIRR